MNINMSELVSKDAPETGDSTLAVPAAQVNRYLSEGPAKLVEKLHK